MPSKRQRSGKALKAPDLPLQKLEKVPAHEALEDGGNYMQYQFLRNDWSERHIRHLALDQTLLEQVTWSGTRIAHMRVLDSRFKSCDFANAEWTQADLARVELLNCHLTGFQMNEARLQDILLKDCLGKFLQCARSTFEAVCFLNCDLSHANFFEADLTGALFVNCDLSHADFTGAKLARADLRGSKVDDTRMDLASLQGASIDPAQALALVRGMGITVEAPDARTP